MRIYADPSGSSKWVWIINKDGVMKQLFTPFRVVCIISTAQIKRNSQVYVEDVYGGLNGDLYFLIFNQPIPHRHFVILSKL